MRHSTFLVFCANRAGNAAFIALPIVSVVLQSIHAPHPAVLVDGNMYASRCTTETSIDQDATADLRAAKPLGRFVGLEIFKDRGHLALSEVKEIWGNTSSFGEFSLGSLIYHFTGLCILR